MARKKSGRTLNPTDAYRKQQRKKVCYCVLIHYISVCVAHVQTPTQHKQEIRKNKKERTRVRDEALKKRGAESIRAEVYTAQHSYCGSKTTLTTSSCV